MPLSNGPFTIPSRDPAINRALMRRICGDRPNLSPRLEDIEIEEMREIARNRRPVDPVQEACSVAAI